MSASETDPIVRQGWQCPQCLRIHSPDAMHCYCGQETSPHRDPRTPPGVIYTYHPIHHGTFYRTSKDCETT